MPALSFCLRDSTAKPSCTFGTLFEILQSFLHARFPTIPSISLEYGTNIAYFHFFVKKKN